MRVLHQALALLVALGGFMSLEHGTGSVVE